MSGSICAGGMGAVRWPARSELGGSRPRGPRCCGYVSLIETRPASRLAATWRPIPGGAVWPGRSESVSRETCGSWPGSVVAGLRRRLPATEVRSSKTSPSKESERYFTVAPATGIQPINWNSGPKQGQITLKSRNRGQRIRCAVWNVCDVAAAPRLLDSQSHSR